MGRPKYTFTVFTPAYNRAKTLPRLYQSICSQTYRNFEWVIVDDGSTDNTREVVNSWIPHSPFPIRYFWQPNGHKKAASNHGIQKAEGELFLTIDSDDELTPQALEILHRHWMSIPESERSNYSAVTGLCVDDAGAIVGETFPEPYLDSNSSEIRYRYKIKSEKCGFQRTDILQAHLFPVDVAGYVPEGIVWSAIGKRYKTRYVNDVLRIYHNDGAGSLSHTVSAGKQSDGLALWARETLDNELCYFRYDPAWFIKMAANYTRFHCHLQRLQPGKNWPLKGFTARMLVALMWPLGYLLFRRDLRSEQATQASAPKE